MPHHWPPLHIRNPYLTLYFGEEEEGTDSLWSYTYIPIEMLFPGDLDEKKPRNDNNNVLIYGFEKLVYR